MSNNNAITVGTTAVTWAQISGGSQLTAGTGITITGNTIAAPNQPVYFQTGSSTGNTLTSPTEYFVCTASCTVTPPVPAAGYVFCVRNDTNTTGTIIMGGRTNIYYEKTDFSTYGTVSGTMTSGGALGDKVCIIGRDSTHYSVESSFGTWVNS